MTICHPERQFESVEFGPQQARLISGAMLLLPFGAGAVAPLRKKFQAAKSVSIHHNSRGVGFGQRLLI